MTLDFCRSLFLFFFVALWPSQAQLPQEPATISKGQAEAYPNTSDGLQTLIVEILRAVKAKDSAKEVDMIHSLRMPNNSTWFTDEYGPGFGASLAAAYGRVSPTLEKEIEAIFKGNVNAPLEHFLNCMDQIVLLYQTAFNGDSASFYMSLKPAENGKQAAGDLDGYFAYDQGGFRFIPFEILMKLPKERPVRIRLDLNVMESKLITKVPVRVPLEAIKKHISGRVVVQLILDIGGNIKESQVLEGDPILSSAVMDAVKQWRFAPTTLDGDPVEVDLEIPTTFELH